MEEACKHEQTFEFRVMAGDGDFPLRIYAEGHEGTTRLRSAKLVCITGIQRMQGRHADEAGQVLRRSAGGL